MQKTKALVTLAIGQTYLERWRDLCQANWQKYADKYEYDIICIDTPLDNSVRAQQRSPSWQKCLILSQEFAQQYERLVWIDADILINASNAPCIVADVPIDKVGAVDVFSSPTSDLSAQVEERRHEFLEQKKRLLLKENTPQDYYANYGLLSNFNQVVQAGVMVFTPNYHREVLEKVYFEYEDKGGPEWHYEMRPLSYELLKADIVHWIDHRFNIFWANYRYLHYPFLLSKAQPDYSIFSSAEQENASALGLASRYRYIRMCATTAFINSFFLHFAGCAPDMALVDLEAKSWRDCTEERVTAAINHDLAKLYTEQGQADQSLSIYEQSLQLQEDVGDVSGKALTLHHIANVYLRQGQVDQALGLYEQSLQLQEHISDIPGKAGTLSMMGRLLAIRGDFVLSLACLQESLEILEFLMSPDAETLRNVITEVQQMSQG